MQTNSPLQSHSTRGYTAALAAAVFLSTTAIFIRYLTLNFQIPALVLAFWRALFVTLTLLPVLTFSRRVDVRSGLAHSKYLVVYGLVLALFNSMWTLSVALNGAAVATVMAYSSAAFTVLLGWWLLKESLTPVKLVAVVFSLAGCFLVSGALDASVQLNPGGILAGILSGLGYAAYSLMGRSAAGRGLNPWGDVALYLRLCCPLPAGLQPARRWRAARGGSPSGGPGLAGLCLAGLVGAHPAGGRPDCGWFWPV
jgi:drug/metabolite transporter (DMT)-like permease